MKYINSQLHKITHSIDMFKFDEINAREHDEKNLIAIKESLQYFGQRIPIVVQKEGMIVRAGNGRLQAAKELGWKKIAAVIIDESDSKATAFALADNRSAELADWKWDQLAENIAYVTGALDDLSIENIGWTEKEINALLTSSLWEAEAENQDDIEGNLSDSINRKISFSHSQIARIEECAKCCDLSDATDSATIVRMCEIAANLT